MNSRNCYKVVVGLVKNIGINLLSNFSKLDLFIMMQQILFSFIKWSSLQKNVRIYSPKDATKNPFMFRSWIVERTLMLSSSFKSDPMHKYELLVTLLCST
jgi:hypothetical protein